MKKIILFLSITLHFSLFILHYLNAQVGTGANTKIGIYEQLGKNIPLDLKFNNENGDVVTLKQLIDKPTVLSFVYFDCPNLCSPLQRGISEVIDRTSLEIGKDYDVLTISFNYRDDPVKAAKKKKNFASCVSKNKCQYWHYLTADSTTINSILSSVGYKIKVTGLDFAHPSGIVVVSPQGKITRYLYGLTFLPFDFKMAIIEAQQGIARPTINRILNYCFAYDTEGKRYSLAITKVSATIIIFLGLVLLGVMIIKPKKTKYSPQSTDDSPQQII